MGAGDRDDPAAEHQRGKRARPVQHPDAAPPGLGQLRVAGPDRARHDKRVRVTEVAGAVADVHPGTERAEFGQHGGSGGVAAGDGDPAGQHDPGNPGHPGAADAGEVHPPEILKRHRFGGRHQAHRLFLLLPR